MSGGHILLILVSILVFSGICQRVLDALSLTDRQALLFVGLILIGSILPPVPLFGRIKISLGGAVVPLLLSLYVFLKADTNHERIRTAIASLAAGCAVLALGIFFPDEPGKMVIDINYLYGVLCGLISCTLTRSRRCAFISGIWGIVLSDVFQSTALWLQGTEQTLYLGSAGILDAIVISGVTAYLASELTGEFRERIRRGAKTENT